MRDEWLKEMDDMAERMYADVSVDAICNAVLASAKHEEEEREREKDPEYRKSKEYNTLIARYNESKGPVTIERYRKGRYGVDEYLKLSKAFHEMNSYKDSEKLAKECENKYNEIKAKIKAEKDKKTIGFVCACIFAFFSVLILLTGNFDPEGGMSIVSVIIQIICFLVLFFSSGYYNKGLKITALCTAVILSLGGIALRVGDEFFGAYNFGDDTKVFCFNTLFGINIMIAIIFAYKFNRYK